MYTFARIEGSNPSLTAKFERTAIQRSVQRLKSKGFKPFLLPYVFQMTLLNPDVVGGITEGIINYPHFYTPKFQWN